MTKRITCLPAARWAAPTRRRAYTGYIKDAEAAPAGRSRTFAALAHPGFRRYWTGLALSNVGTWMQTFALGYLVVQIAVAEGAPERGPGYLGLVGLSRAIPGLSLGLIGGAIADRVERRGLLLATQACSATVALSLALLVGSGHAILLPVLLLSALDSAVTAFDTPARQALLPHLVTRATLASGVGLSSSAFNLPQVIGPLLGGLLYAPLGAAGLFALNGLSYLVFLLLLLGIAPAPGDPSRATSMLRSVREGLAWIAGDPVARWVAILSLGTSVLSRPYGPLLPAVNERFLGGGSSELAALLAAAGAGSLVGSLAAATSGGARRGAMLAGSATVLGALVVLLGAQRTLPAAMIVTALAGATSMVFMGTANTLQQSRVPERFRGRVMSVQAMVYVGFLPLGTLIVGGLGSLVGLDRALELGGGLVVLLALAAFRGPLLTASGAR